MSLAATAGPTRHERSIQLATFIQNHRALLYDVRFAQVPGQPALIPYIPSKTVIAFCNF